MTNSAGQKPRFVRFTDAVERETDKNGVKHSFLDYFGKSSSIQGGPEAFLVRYGAGRTTRAHYHPVDQFQIFFGVPGAMYQRHPIPKVLLHYADAYSTYGPFSTVEPMTFFTLRPFANSVTGFMPEDRDLMQWRGTRQHHAELDELLVGAASQSGTMTISPLFDDESDGLHAELVTTGNGSFQLVSSRGSGTFACVLSGEVAIRGQTYGEKSLGWISPDAALNFDCIDGRAHLLALTFPSPLTTHNRGV